jgi:predicted ABC-type ATPase
MLKKNGKKPNLYIIAGPNGAGKTTFAREFLLDIISKSKVRQ